jgi:AcrR family transcriptional regulator
VSPNQTVVDIRAARAAMEADTRAALLAAGAKVLSEEGPSALTLRRVADAVNCSTKMIYTHFGGKDGLLDALYLHSFAGLTTALNGAPEDGDALRRLESMAGAYRDFALAEPALYNVMFGDLGRAWEAPLASRRQAWKSFETLKNAVSAAMPSARAEEATLITHLFWAAMHGVVSLEMRRLIGASQDGEQLFRQAITAVFKTHGIVR